MGVEKDTKAHEEVLVEHGNLNRLWGGGGAIHLQRLLYHNTILIIHLVCLQYHTS